jgi:predicted nucleic acid-binding protein
LESAKCERAITLLERDDVGLSIQVLGELYVQATRATRSDALPHGIAAGLIEAWLHFPVQEIARAVLIGALDIKAAHGFSYWDSAIVAAAATLGWRELYTEDLSHGREVQNVRIVDPFR